MTMLHLLGALLTPLLAGTLGVMRQKSFATLRAGRTKAGH